MVLIIRPRAYYLNRPVSKDHLLSEHQREAFFYNPFFPISIMPLHHGYLLLQYIYISAAKRKFLSRNTAALGGESSIISSGNGPYWYPIERIIHYATGTTAATVGTGAGGKPLIADKGDNKTCELCKAILSRRLL